MTPRSAILVLCLAFPSVAQAGPQSVNYQLISDGIISGGETSQGGQARVVASAIGEPINNDVATALFKLSEGHFAIQQQLLNLLPHQAPTMTPIASPTAVAAQTLTGTKAPDTSLWLNGAQVIPLTAETTWSHPIVLAEGNNTLSIATKDVFGNTSATITTAALLDTSPPSAPVVLDDGAFTAILTQLHAAWTASDPGSGIAQFEYRIGTTTAGSEVMAPTGIGLATELTKTGLTLAQGQRYYVAVRAQNRAGLWSDWGASDGIDANVSAPVISALLPPAGSKFPPGTAKTLSASAMDADGDALEYQFSVGSSVLQAWSSSSTYAWAPTRGQIGVRAIKVDVRDGHGRSAGQEHEIYVIRQPVTPPSP